MKMSASPIVGVLRKMALLGGIANILHNAGNHSITLEGGASQVLTPMFGTLQNGLWAWKQGKS